MANFYKIRLLQDSVNFATLQEALFVISLNFPQTFDDSPFSPLRSIQDIRDMFRHPPSHRSRLAGEEA